MSNQQTQTSFENELKNSVSVVELEQRLEMIQAWGYYCCEYGDHPQPDPSGGPDQNSSCGSL